MKSIFKNWLAIGGVFIVAATIGVTSLGAGEMAVACSTKGCTYYDNLGFPYNGTCGSNPQGSGCNCTYGSNSQGQSACTS